MSNENDVQSALENSARRLLKRELTYSERLKLSADFRELKSTPVQRAFAALSKTVNLSETEIQVRAAASDDADRAIKDLEKVAKGLTN